MVSILPECPGRSRILLLLQQVFGGSFGDHPASFVTASWAEVDHVVAGPDEIEVVFDHLHGVALVRQGAEHFHQALNIGAVEAGGGFVQDIEGGRAVGPELACQLDALGFAAGEGRAGLAEGEVAEAEIAEHPQGSGDL